MACAVKAVNHLHHILRTTLSAIFVLRLRKNVDIHVVDSADATTATVHTKKSSGKPEFT